MPKAAAYIPRNVYSRSLIEQGIVKMQTTPDKVAKRLRMSRSTFFLKKADPETFTVGQACEMAEVFDWDDAELLSFLKGRKVT